MRAHPLLLLVCLGLLGLSGCVEGPQALLFSNLVLGTGQSGVVTLSAAALPQFNSLQVGPKGAITFDPTVIEVTSVAGANGFVVFASEIDNAAGEITLAAGSTSGPVPNGTVLEFGVRAVGASGTSTSLAITSVDFLLKVSGEPITGYKLTPGKVSVN